MKVVKNWIHKMKTETKMEYPEYAPSYEITKWESLKLDILVYGCCSLPVLIIIVVAIIFN